MLSKVNKSNVFLGTNQLQKLYDDTKYDLAQDNGNNQILYKIKNQYQIINYNTNKIYNHNKIQINILGEKFIKQIDSFDQNNLKISNIIRHSVIRLCGKKNYQTILGIGGEYYVYFKFIKAKKYFGMSNHQCIVDDANYNIPFSNNYLVDYSKINTNINTNTNTNTETNNNTETNINTNIETNTNTNIETNTNTITNTNIDPPDLIILNVYNICESIIKYICKINFEKLIIITCNLSENKLNQINSYFKIKTIKHIQNFKSWIRIIEISNIR
jgi:hypothetical protein